MSSTIHDTRRQNLRQVLSDKAKNDRNELARMIGRERNQIDQLLTRKPMGGRLARIIEKKLTLKSGWMDNPHIDGMAPKYSAQEETPKVYADPAQRELQHLWGKLSPELRERMLEIMRTLAQVATKR